MKRFKYYLWKNKGLLILNIFTITMAAIFTVGMAFILQNMIDSTVTGNIATLGTAALVGFVFMLMQMFVNLFDKLVRTKFTQKILCTIKDDLFENLMGKNIKTFNEENSATYISILNNDMKMIEDAYFNNVLRMIYYGVSFVLALGSMILINPFMTLAIAVVGVLPIIVPLILGKKLSKARDNYSNHLEIFITRIKDYFNGFEVIKSFQIEDKATKTYKEANDKVEKLKFNMNALIATVDEVSTMFGFMMFIVTMGLGSYFVIKGQMTMGLMIATVQLMNYIVGPVTMISQQISQLKSVKGIEEKFIKIMRSEVKEDIGLEKISYQTGITFKDIKFSYDEGTPILRGVDLALEKGKKYAIVGGSGSGKSTLLKLLMRYYEDFQGEICIDGIDNRSVKVSSLYDLLSVIHQNVFMFDDNIENNITLYQDYSKGCVEEVIEKAGLTPLIKRLKEGVKTQVGEAGNRLSGGEKQRIAIARALIKETPILVLDEATSSLDNETAYYIEKSILNLEDLTCLVVTHKLNEESLRQYDEIIVLKDGKVEEKGSFKELLNQKSYFYSLYNVMAGGRECIA